MPGELLSVPACHASSVSSRGLARKPREGDIAQQFCLQRLTRYIADHGVPGESVSLSVWGSGPVGTSSNA